MRRGPSEDAEPIKALDDDEQFRRSMMTMTLVWGFGLIAQATLASILVFHLSISSYPGEPLHWLRNNGRSSLVDVLVQPRSGMTCNERLQSELKKVVTLGIRGQRRRDIANGRFGSKAVILTLPPYVPR